MKRFVLLLCIFALLPLALPAYGAPDAEVEPPAKAAKVAPAAATADEKKTETNTGEPKPPADVGEAIEKGKEAVAAAKSGQWWYFSSVVCLLLMFVLKTAGLLKKMGRWKYIVLPVLSLAAALLAALQGGVTLQTAVGVFTSSWVTGMLEELWNHGILKKPHESAPPG